MELLSPCGNFLSLKLAVQNGADAVYLGVSNFNARNNISDGFNERNIEDAIIFSHSHNVKVYLTLNILIRDDEMLKAVELAINCWNYGVDAIIIQDIGLACLLHEFAPNIVLHASTQLAVHNVAGAKKLKEIGFTRVVLSRECSLDEIKQIKLQTGLEIEFFVQGALCVSFSGNCYLCSHFINRSGNRGVCAQYCRQPLTLSLNSIKKQGYFLSAKDFCLINRLKDLFLAGVDSLKIEGRARRPFYIATATKVYREVLDKNYKVSKSNYDDLCLAFNREFTEGYFKGNSSIISNYSSHIGIEIGKVESVSIGKRFTTVKIITNYNLTKKSSIKIFRNKLEIDTISLFDLKKVDNGYIFTTSSTKCKKGDIVNIIQDEKKENEIYKDNRLHSILKLNVIGNILYFRLQCENEYVQDFVEVTESINKPFTLERVDNIFSKLEYFKVKVDKFDFNVFLLDAKIKQISKNLQINLLNKLNKDYLNRANHKIENLKISIENIKNKLKFQKNTNNFIKSKKYKIFYVKNNNEIFNLNIQKNYENLVILRPEDYSNIDLNGFIEISKKLTFLPVLFTPNFATEKDFDLLKKILSDVHISIVVNNLYALDLVNKNKGFLAGGFLNVYNSVSCEYFKNFGAKIFLLQEYDDNRAEEIENNCGVICLKDKINYMTLLHCPFKEFYNSSCNKCTYMQGLKYKILGRELSLNRIKLNSCIFYLED